MSGILKLCSGEARRSDVTDSLVTVEFRQGYFECEADVIIGVFQTPKGLQSVYSTCIKGVQVGLPCGGTTFSFPKTL